VTLRLLYLAGARGAQAGYNSYGLVGLWVSV
jgi:hypothetical protein